jgi:serine protease Do
MIRSLHGVAASLITLATVIPSAQVAAQSELRVEIAAAKQKIYPALVNIGVVSKDFGGGRTIRQMGNGSGTLISPGGHVLTNYHVARDALRIVCTLTTGEQIPADVVGHDPMTDLSVLKMRVAEREDPNKPLPFATFGDSDKLDVGDYVLAVGNPLSLSSSMTLGIVSNPRRVFTGAGGQIFEFDFDSGNRTGLFTVWIQHDALILPGNSGGPLVNLQGQIIGVNTRGGNGVGFASPAKLVRRVVNQLLMHGEVRRGYVGASFQPVARMGHKRGALISAIVPNGPAHKAGLHTGDLLLAIGDAPVTARFAEEVPPLYRHVSELAAGKKASFHILRDGKEHKIDVDVARMQDYVGEEVEMRRFGITVQDITEPMAQLRRYPNAKGVRVSGVRAGQPFEEAKPGIRSGDVIVKLAGKEVVDLASMREIIKGFEGTDLAVEFRRGRESLVTLVDLEVEDKPKSGGELAKAWLGLRAQVMTEEVQKAMDLEGTKGFRVTEVYPWTKAADAGFQTGDVILSMDDEAFDSFRPQDAKDLKNRVEDYGIGEVVPFEILREGKKQTLEVELEESPSSSTDAKGAASAFFEFKVRELTFMDRIARRLDKEQKAMIITEVANGGWASIAGLPTNALILAIDGKPIGDVDSFKKAMEELQEKKPRVVPVFIQRGTSTAFVFIEPDWSQSESK